MKKLIPFLLLTFLLATFLLATFSSAYAINISDSELSSIVKVEVYENHDQKNPIGTGTGFFVTYDGCIILSDHVLYNSFKNENYPFIKINIANHVKNIPDIRFNANIKFSDHGKDIAMICIDNSEGKFFDIFDLATVEEIDNMRLQDEVFMLGYPLIGGKTLTVTKGAIAGFWENPNLEDFLGISYFDDESIDIFKVDGVTGPGGSGGPVILQNKKVSGVVFAASLSPGGIGFIISSKTIRSAINKYNDDLRKKKHLSADQCIYDSETKLYKMNGVNFYDAICTFAQNKRVENIVKLNYKDRCKINLSTERVHQATNFISSKKTTVDKWWEYVTAICPVIDAEIMQDSNSVQPVDSMEINPKPEIKIFKYDSARKLLSEETNKAIVLKQELMKYFSKGIPVSTKNWHKLVNAYIYGRYPVEAIWKSIIFGGRTVHPSIPYSAWRNTRDYLDYIDR